MTEDRKARLAALAARAGRSHTNDEENTNENNEGDTVNENNKELKFRNYTPKDSKLAPSTESEEPTKKKSKYNIENSNNVGGDDDNDTSSKRQEPKSELEKALQEAKVDAALTLQQQDGNDTLSGPNNVVDGSSQISVTAIAPKKVNWDLKRDIAKKLNKLEKRTQKAIVELLKERMEREAEEEEDEEEENDLD